MAFFTSVSIAFNSMARASFSAISAFLLAMRAFFSAISAFLFAMRVSFSAISACFFAMEPFAVTPRVMLDIVLADTDGDD